jgi:hypothetical protein
MPVEYIPDRIQACFQIIEQLQDAEQQSEYQLLKLLEAAKESAPR